MRWLRYGVLLLAVVACSRSESVPAAKTVPSEPPAAGASRAGLMGASARLVKDINTTNGSANPQGLVDVNGTVYFSATDGLTGRELWKSDGSAAGTVLVKDLLPGSADSAPMYMTPVNGTVYFSATDGLTGRELWKSDGSAAGTVLVKNIRPGSDDSEPRQLTNVNGTLFFAASDGWNNQELWKSDGTAAGTVLVKDIFPGANGSGPQYLTNVNGMLFFAAADDWNTGELWKSDGTAAGTVRVKDIRPGLESSRPQYLTNVNGTLYFSADDGVNGVELWKSDGTAAGTVLVKDIRPGSGGSQPQQLTNVNGTLYFSADDGANGTELWKSDGTAAGTVLVKDIRPGSDGSQPWSLANFNGTLYFAASGGVEGQSLWKSDGSATGTLLVKTLRPGQVWPGVYEMKEVGGALYFSAHASLTAPWELWKSDGTTAGTLLVRSIPPESLDNALSLTDVGGKLYFRARDIVSGVELWKSDGTVEGTVLVKDIHGNTASSMPGRLTSFKGASYFCADDGVNGRSLWKSDGTAEGTVRLKAVDPCRQEEGARLLEINGTLYFPASDGVSGVELWKSDGTAAGTVLVKDIFPGSDSSSPEYLTNVNGTLFFAANDGVNGSELWKSDGTAAGTVLVKDIFPSYGPSSPQSLANVNGTLFFAANDGVNGLELWKSDGRAAGTVLVKDIRSGSDSSWMQDPMIVNGTLYFLADDGVHGYELWKSDGRAAGTVLVKDIRPGSDSSSAYRLTNLNGTLVFTANNGVNGTELWKSDGSATGTVLVKDIFPGAGHSFPSPFTNFKGTLYFAANDGVNGFELWKSDGSAAGTVLVQDIFPGADHADPQFLTSFQDLLYFAASDGPNGRELWRSDGTAAGTVLVQDLEPGAASGSPTRLTQVGTAMFFVSGTLAHGRELWRMGDGAPPTVTCPAAQNALATSAAGALVTYPPATATDDQTASPRLTYSVASGALFALGDTRVTVTATDDAGNTARCDFSVRVVPPAPTVSAPQDGAVSPSPLSVTGTALEGATVHVLEEATVLGTFSANASGAFQGTLALAPRVYTLRFTQTLGGTASAPTAARTVTVEPPAPVLTRPATGASVVGPLVRVEGTGLPGATARVLEEGTPVADFSVTGEGTFAGELLLAYGAHRLTAVQVAQGQTSTASAPVLFEVRPAAPEVTSPADGSTFDGPRVAITGSGVPGAQVEVREAGALLTTLPVGGDGRFSGEVQLAPGTHGLSFVQKAGGATSDARGPRSVSVRPPSPVLSSPAANARVPGPQVVLQGTALAGARVFAEESGVSLGSTSADAAGAFQLSVTLAYGPRVLALQQETAGLPSPARAAAFTVIPAPPAITQPLDGATVGSSVEVRGTGLPGARVLLRDGALVLAQLDADAAGAFLLDVSLAHGPHTLTAVQRVQGEDSSASAPVHLNAVFNRAPVADAQALSVAEDGRLTVTLTAQDADGDALTFSLQTPPAHGALEGTPPVLTYVPSPDFHGADRFTFAVSDGQAEATASVRLTVTPVNDAPVAHALSATTGEGQSVALTLSGHDVEGDALTYAVVAAPAHGGLQGTPPEVIYTPTPGFVGTETFTFRVKDGQSESAPATVSVRVVATRLTVSVSDLAPWEGQAVTFSASLADASATPTFAWDFGDGTTSTEPAPRHAFPDDGVYTVRVSATDADGTRHASVPVAVRNAPPVVKRLSLPDALTEAQDVELSAEAEDPAGSADTLTYQWDFGDGSPPALGPTVRHAFRDDGAFTVVLTVRDEDGGETRAQASLTVANVPPSAVPPERQVLAVGEPLSLPLSASDVAGDADPLVWKKSSGPGAVTPEGLFTWVPTLADVGEATIQLEVSDDEGGRAEVTLVVEVLPPEATGCGCGASGGASGLFALLLGLGLRSRRRLTPPRPLSAPRAHRVPAGAA